MCLTMFPELWFTQAKDWNLSKCCSQYSDGVLSHARLFVSPWTVCSLPVFFVHGISQARTLEWVAISSSREDLPHSGIKPQSPALQVDSLLSEPSGKPIITMETVNKGTLNMSQAIRPCDLHGQILSSKQTHEAPNL